MTQRQTHASEEFDTGHLLLWVVRAGITLVMAVPLIYSGETLFPFIVGKAIYARSVIEVTFGVWLLLIFFYPRYRPRRSLVIAALAIWLLVSLIAGLVGVSLTRSIWSTYERMQGIVDLTHWFVFIAMAGSVFRTLSDWRILFTINLIVCIIISLIGINEYYSYFPLEAFSYNYRIGSSLGNPTYLGAYTMVSALIALGLIVHSLGNRPPNDSERVRKVTQRRARRRRGRAAQRRTASTRTTFDYLPWLQSVWVLSVMLSLWTLWLTGTRGAVVGLGTAAFIFAVGYLAWGRIRIARMASYALVATALVLIALFIAARTTTTLNPIVESSTMLTRLASIGLEDPNISGRVASSRAGLRAFMEKPVLGWGPENFMIAWGKHIGPESIVWETFDQAHSKLVEELTTKGAAGLISYMLVWAAIAWAMFISIRRRRDHERIAVLVLAAAMFAYFVQNLFLFDTPVTLMQFSLLAAFAIAQEYWAGERDKKREQSWVPKRLSGAILQPVSTILRAQWGSILLIALVSVIVVGALYSLNLRIYNASVEAAKVLGQRGWEASLDHADDSISTFPGLANYPRRYILSGYLNRLESLPNDEFWNAVESMETIGNDALAIEPDNWRIIALMAHLYQAAGERDSEYLAKAEERLDKMILIAPNIPTTRNLAESLRILTDKVP